MTFTLALRWTEILLALAFIQQSAEHMSAPADERRIFLPRLLLSLLLLCGIQTPLVCLALFITTLQAFQRFQGPYNGGSDRMSPLILTCLCMMALMPSQRWREVIFGYLAMQLLLSYFISGWVKLANPEWRNGRALRDVFLFSTYPVSEALRAWAKRPKRVYMASWGVMLFEVVFPFSLLSHATLVAALVIAAIFHLANACLFGLNRFFWVWLAAYPSLLWLQERLFG